jgi:excinuclease UvrABC nuclease subunit
VTFPGDVGCYVVYPEADSDRPLYVGVAARRGLDERWKDHLGRRSGSSALRRSLAVHLGLVDEKLRLPDRYYPPEVEEALTKALKRGFLELYPCESESEALVLEAELIAKLDPMLNVKRN